MITSDKDAWGMTVDLVQRRKFQCEARGVNGNPCLTKDLMWQDNNVNY